MPDNSQQGAWIDENRLGRIESKVDRLTEAITNMARIEERMVTVFNRIDSYEQKLAAYELRHSETEKRVTSLETGVWTNGRMLRFAERIFWIVVAAGVAWFFKAEMG